MADRTYRTLKPGEAIPTGSYYRKHTKHGYVLRVWRVAPKTYVQCLEHRVVAGVVTRDHVHHVNGIKDDNRPENLQVISPGEHTRIHHTLPVDEGEICRLYSEGWSSLRISAELGIATATILRVLERNDVERRRPRAQVDYEAVKAMHADGVRCLAMQRRLGVGRKAIMRAFRELGLTAFPVGMSVHWSRYKDREQKVAS
jgi:hypothetical protein